MSTGREKLQALRAHLDESLFPRVTRPRWMLARWESLVLVLALLALGIVLQLARPGWSGSLHTLWAEDGSVFLQAAMTQSFGHTIFAVYPNYLVVVPRLIAEAATLVPLRDAPEAISILSATVVALSGLVVWRASAGHIRNPYLRGTLAVLTVLVPVGGLESVDSASYVSWYMLFATFWILLWRPTTMRGALFASLFVVATALSNPGAWFFVPLAALRALAIRDRRDVAIVSSFAVGAAVQIPVAISHPSATEPAWTHDIWTVYLQRVVDGALLGLRLGGSIWSDIGWPLLIALVLAGLVGFAFGARRASQGPRYLAAIAILTSLVMFFASMYQRAAGAVMVWPEGLYNGIGGRYAIVPALLLICAAIALVDDSLCKRAGYRGFSWAAATTVTILLIALGTSFYLRDLVARGIPPWDAALKAAATACTTERLRTVAIQTSPPGFAVALPCDRISSYAGPQPAPGPG